MRGAALLIMGSEHVGLDASTMEAAEQSIAIPMQGVMSSLNVAVAASLILYEVSHVRSSTSRC